MLDVGPDATEREVQSAFRQQALLCHPDRHPGDLLARGRFERLTRAKEALLDPAERARAEGSRLDAEAARQRGRPAAGAAGQRGPPCAKDASAKAASKAMWERVKLEARLKKEFMQTAKEEKLKRERMQYAERKRKEVELAASCERLRKREAEAAAERIEKQKRARKAAAELKTRQAAAKAADEEAERDRRKSDVVHAWLSGAAKRAAADRDQAPEAAKSPADLAAKGGRGKSTAQDAVKELREMGLGDAELRERLYLDGYTKSRVSQLLKATAQSGAAPVAKRPAAEDGRPAGTSSPPLKRPAAQGPPAGKRPAAAAAPKENQEPSDVATSERQRQAVKRLKWQRWRGEGPLSGKRLWDPAGTWWEPGSGSWCDREAALDQRDALYVRSGGLV